jgi:hypothetical protein
MLQTELVDQRVDNASATRISALAITKSGPRLGNGAAFAAAQLGH